MFTSMCACVAWMSWLSSQVDVTTASSGLAPSLPLEQKDGEPVVVAGQAEVPPLMPLVLNVVYFLCRTVMCVMALST